MTGDIVIVAGPATLRGPGVIDAELAAAALHCIDDDLGLVGVKVKDAQRIWADALAAAAGGRSVTKVTVVCPSFWPPNRIDRIRQAACTVASEVLIRDRREVLWEVADQPHCPVIEMGEELVVLARPGSPAAVFRRSSPALAGTVQRALADASSVIIDVPSGIVGAEADATELAGRLGTAGTDVTVLGCADLYRDGEVQEDQRRWQTRVSVLAALVVIGLLTLAVCSGNSPQPAPVAASAEAGWLVEGQVAMQVPLGWTVERVLSGTGSARVRITSPEDAHRGIHLTQTPVPARPSLAESARALRAAAAGLRAGVIVDFNDTATAAGRAAVTYREVRADAAVQWTVLLDDTVRIAIGCQGPDIAGPCDMAIRSAHRNS